MSHSQRTIGLMILLFHQPHAQNQVWHPAGQSTWNPSLGWKQKQFRNLKTLAMDFQAKSNFIKMTKIGCANGFRLTSSEK
jgi:hypothetical protein